MEAKPLPEAIERVLLQFEQWRGRKSARDRIPERLWHAAAAAAQRHGVHAVSRAVRLEPAALRRRVAAGSVGTTEAFAFMELGDAATGGAGGCVIDLEKGNGTRLRVWVRDGAAVDWAQVKEAFLGA